MSITARILKFAMRLVDIKGRLKNTSAKALHRRSVPRPPGWIRLRHKTEEINIEGCTAYWLSKKSSDNGVLIYLHGGGFVMGPVFFQWNYISNMALRTKMAALVIDYRQLPKYPFPTGLEDVVNVIKQLQNEGLNNNWHLIGDSAGGNLALAAAYSLRQTGYKLPEKMVLMSPFLDVSMSNPDLELSREEDPILNIDLDFVKRSYAPEREWRNPLVSPIYGDLKGLPPILLQVGTSEVLLWDIRKFYKLCLQSGITIQYEEYKGLFHDFPIFPFLPEARQARKQQDKFLREDS